jgi:hypothetical protein
MKDTVPFVGMTFNRKGNMSVYGDIKVDYITVDGKIIRVGQANGVAVYTPNSSRRFVMALQNYNDVDLKKGRLLVQFLSQSDLNPELIDEAEIILK